jgi:cysteinyl-tRNA synthetase
VNAGVLYDTLTGQERNLPEAGSVINLYVCGPTVYDRLHLGNFRTFVLFDVLRRYLTAVGYVVRHAVNVTDVDDKMIRRAAEERLSVPELAAKYRQAYEADRSRLGILRPHEEPAATDYVPAMVADIARLVEMGLAYPSANGDVHFRTRRFPSYGRLSGQDLSALMAGARVEADPAKEDPLDFALWKAEKPGEPAWQSPWGPGRPGWHMECTTMLRQLFGEHADLHGGGQDLMFPHHENERAQSNALAHGREVVGHWLHGGLLMTEGEKMSKSLGNTLSVERLSTSYSPMALRLFLLSAHYRKPQTVTDMALRAAQQGWERLAGCLDALRERAAEAPDMGPTSADQHLLGALEAARRQMLESLGQDLNAAQALGHLFEVTRQINAGLRGEVSRGGLRGVEGAYGDLWALLGLDPGSPRRPAAATGGDPEREDRVAALVAARDRARRERDFATADRLRAELSEIGVVVEDTPAGSRWQWRDG